MTQTWFIGDTHFNHAKIITFEATRPFRPFATIEEHDAELVRRWNDVVRPKDVVWHLGDFCFGKSALQIAAQLNGDKRLIMGNHDHYPTGEYLKYFTKVLGAVQYKGMILTHIPVHEVQLMHRFTHNVHGHLHGERIKLLGKEIFDERYINVSAEQINLAPINFEDLRTKFLKQNYKESGCLLLQ